MFSLKEFIFHIQPTFNVIFYDKKNEDLLQIVIVYVHLQTKKCDSL